MLLREGSQSRAPLLTFLGVAFTTASIFGGAAWAAGKTEARGVELPREVLPWRREVEKHASILLKGARRLIRNGSKYSARRQLRRIVDRFPRTHAAMLARRDLAMLEEPRVAGINRQGLGALRQMPIGDWRTETAPVAGWQTVVRPDASKLHDALMDAAGDRVFFQDNSIRLSRQAVHVLRQQARWLKRHEDVEVRIVGHADDKGSRETNLRLSHDRAVAVRKRLMRFGISPRRLHVFSHGKAQPIAICTVSTCAAQNRRVITEVKLTRRTAANAR